MPTDDYDQGEIDALRTELAQRPAPTGALDSAARTEIESCTEDIEAVQEEIDAQEESEADLDALEYGQDAQQTALQDGNGTSAEGGISVGMAPTDVVRQPPRVRARRTRFLARLRQTGNIRAASAYAQISKRTAFRWREKDAWFAQKWTEALEDYADLADMRASQLAIEGIKEPIVAMGQVVGYRDVFSEKLLLRILEKAKPEKWAPVRSESSVRVSGSVADGAGAGALSEEARAALQARVAKLAPLLMARHSQTLKGQGPVQGPAPKTD